jgi:ABC-type tungstate transport system permease subunit
MWYPRFCVLVEGDPRLLNRYDVILLNPGKHPVPKQALGQRFAQWLLSPEGQAAIGGYEVADCIVGATVQILGRPRVDPPGR